MNSTRKADKEPSGAPCPRPTERTVRAWARLVRVSQALLARVESDLRRAGYPPLSHYDALLELRRAGRRGLRPFELQREMLLAQYSVSRLVDRLDRAGHIARSVSPDDARGQRLHITPSGRRLLKRMWPVYARAIHQRFEMRLDREDMEKLMSILGKLRDKG